MRPQYTPLLKPITFVKNISVAMVVAASTMVGAWTSSGLLREASVSVRPTTTTTTTTAWWKLKLLLTKAAARAASSPSPIPVSVSVSVSISTSRTVAPLSLAVFFGIVAREIYMDMLDVEHDSRTGIKTIPIVYGEKFAGKVALCASGLLGVIVASVVGGKFMRGGGGLGVWGLGRGLLGLAGVTRMMYNSVGVYRNAEKRENAKMEIEDAIEETKLTMFLMLMGFV